MIPAAKGSQPSHAAEYAEWLFCYVLLYISQRPLNHIVPGFARCSKPLRGYVFHLRLPVV
jgi:hypothetical protein